MTPRLPQLEARELVQILKKVGFREVRQKGSHRTFAKIDDPSCVVTVPIHSGDIKRGTLASILKRSGISVDDLTRLR